MAKKKDEKINGRFDDYKEPRMSIIVWGGLTLIFASTLVLAVPCGIACAKKVVENRMIKRFRRYARVIGFRESITLRELANSTQVDIDTVKKDLIKMLDRGWFGKGAFLNAGGGTLFTPLGEADSMNWAHTIRDMFRNVRDGFEEVKNEASAAAKAAAEAANATQRAAESHAQTVSAETEKSARNTQKKPTRKAEQEVRQEVKTEVKTEAKPNPQAAAKNASKLYSEEMERTLGELYRLNVQIEDEPVSKRIDRIGVLTAGIFRVVIANPAREGEVRKFMNYYLPTTLKLLKSYDILEDDAVQSESITASRRKIESVLDRLIVAFEQLYEKLHSSDALDLDTDIQVLETMMASDGLTDKGNIRMTSH